MNEYYGIATTPTSDFLAHYGVKGMHWGVRKALDRGSERGLRRQFKKASKHLAKLQNKANTDYQRKRIKSAGISQKSDAVAAGLNLGLAGALTAATKRTWIPVGAGVSAVDAIYSQIEKRNARKLASESGHKEAAKKANDFRKEMNKAFKGTQYEGNTDLAKDIAAKKRKGVERLVDTYENRNARKLKSASPKNKSNKMSEQDLQAFAKLADNFERHYQNGISRGMSHEKAERYANNKLSPHRASNHRKRG